MLSENGHDRRGCPEQKVAVIWKRSRPKGCQEQEVDVIRKR